MKISEVANMMGLPTSTIRYYDSEGLLPHLKKDESGQRIFDNIDIEQLRIIECLKKSGMQIKEIKTFIEWTNLGSSSIPKRYEMFLKQKKRVQKELEELKNTLKIINYKCWYYEKALKTNEKEAFSTPFKDLPENVKEGYLLLTGQED